MRRLNSLARSVLTLGLMLALAMLAHVTALAGSGTPMESNVAVGQQAVDPLEPLPRPVYLYAGTCDDLGDIQWPLNPLTSPDGQKGGPEADRTEYSFTANVPLTISDMLAGEYAIGVHESGESIDNVIACGNVGGVANSVGTLVVGLREHGGSGVTGIAVLSPSPADPAMTYISVFITGAGLGDAVGTIGVTPPPVADGEGPVDSDPPPDASGPPPDGDGDGGGDDDGDDGGGDDD